MSYGRSNPICPRPAIHVSWRCKTCPAELLGVQTKRVPLGRVLSHWQCPADRLRREFAAKTGLILGFARRHILSLSRVQRDLVRVVRYRPSDNVLFSMSQLS